MPKIKTSRAAAKRFKKTGKDFDIHKSSGNSFPEDLDTYDLVIHCAG